MGFFNSQTVIANSQRVQAVRYRLYSILQRAVSSLHCLHLYLRQIQAVPGYCHLDIPRYCCPGS